MAYKSYSINDFLYGVPTTKLRIIVSLGLSIFVIIATVTRNYTPSAEVLGFILIQMGIDVTQYTMKAKHGTPDPDPVTPTDPPAVVPQPNPSDES